VLFYPRFPCFPGFPWIPLPYSSRVFRASRASRAPCDPSASRAPRASTASYVRHFLALSSLLISSLGPLDTKPVALASMVTRALRMNSAFRLIVEDKKYEGEEEEGGEGETKCSLSRGSQLGLVEVEVERYKNSRRYYLSLGCYLFGSACQKYKGTYSARYRLFRLPPATCHLPPATCHLPPATYHLYCLHSLTLVRAWYGDPILSA
jgi:hypothetical protein